MTLMQANSSSNTTAGLPIRVLLVDDHPLIREAIRSVLQKEKDMLIVGEAGNGEEAIEMAGKLSPDVIMMDYNMPKMDGLHATRMIKERHPQVAIIVLTVLDDEQSISDILQAGASGYLLKSVFGKEVVTGIRSVVSGGMVLSPAIGRQLISQTARRPQKPVKLDEGGKLTHREVEILKMVATGMANKEIAAALGLSLRTIKGHLVDIFSKLGVSSRTEAVMSGLRSGYLSMEDTK